MQRDRNDMRIEVEGCCTRGIRYSDEAELISYVFSFYSDMRILEEFSKLKLAKEKLFIKAMHIFFMHGLQAQK